MQRETPQNCQCLSDWFLEIDDASREPDGVLAGEELRDFLHRIDRLLLNTQDGLFLFFHSVSLVAAEPIDLLNLHRLDPRRDVIAGRPVIVRPLQRRLVDLLDVGERGEGFVNLASITQGGDER